MCASFELPGAWSAPVRGAHRTSCSTSNIIYSTNWGHYQYPFAPNGQRTCQASVCLINHEYLDALRMCVVGGERASGALVHPMGANTTQYHPIPPQYHPPMNANTTPKDDHPMPTDQCQCRTPDGGAAFKNAHYIHTTIGFL